MLQLRIIWAALILGQLTFLGIILSGVIPLHGAHQPILGEIALILLVTAVPISFLIRTLILRFAIAEGEKPVRTVMAANLVFWAACESVCFFSQVTVIVSSWTSLAAICIGVCLGLQVMTFPRGD